MKTEVAGGRRDVSGGDRLFEDEIWGGGGGGRESEWSALGWKVDGDAEGDLKKEFGLFSPVGVQWR